MYVHSDIHMQVILQNNQCIIIIIHAIPIPSDSSCSSCSLTLAAGLAGGVLDGDSLKLMLCLFSLARGDGWATSSPDWECRSEEGREREIMIVHAHAWVEYCLCTYMYTCITVHVHVHVYYYSIKNKGHFQLIIHVVQ